MNTKELNEYILNYLKNDKTQSAIMLTAPWGTGKSYYIKNTLMPAIDTEDEKKCVLVSLYGLKDISEISKSIYLEIRAKRISKLSEKANAVKLVGGTVVKGVASFFGVDLSVSEEKLQQLYESIDLTGKLIILEDLERSQIDIIEVMGYVNNLCEQDGVKVLLVANEGEILRKEYEKHNTKWKVDGLKLYKDQPQEDNKAISISSNSYDEYKTIKEKTISDTLCFPPYVDDSIINIMKGFNNKYFNAFLEAKDDNGRIAIIDALEKDVMGYDYIRCYNLRSFIIACQKTIELYEQLNNDKEHNLGYLKYLLLTNTAFVLRKKQDDNICWDASKDKFRSARLGTSKYPLPEFCYEYICYHYLNAQQLNIFESLYCYEQEDASTEKEVKDILKIIYSYYERTESEVIDALNKLKVKLQSLSVPYSEYGKLANYLVAIKFALDDSKAYNELKTIMLANLQSATPENAEKIREHSGIYLDDNEQVQELNTFMNQMMAILEGKNKGAFDFDYKTESIEKFYNEIIKKRDDYVSKRIFARRFDNEKLVKMLESCSAFQIENIRRCFRSVYSFSNINEFFSEDKESLIDLKQKVETLLSTSTKLDKIQRLQLKYFVSNLEDYINRL